MTTDSFVRKGAAKDAQEQAIRDSFGARLDRLRLARGFTSHAALAKKAGLERSVVTRLINGDNRANVEQIAGLATALGCSPADLVGSAAQNYAVSDPSAMVARDDDGGGYQVKTTEGTIIASRLDAVSAARRQEEAGARRRLIAPPPKAVSRALTEP